MNNISTAETGKCDKTDCKSFIASELRRRAERTLQFLSMNPPPPMGTGGAEPRTLQLQAQLVLQTPPPYRRSALTYLCGRHVTIVFYQGCVPHNLFQKINALLRTDQRSDPVTRNCLLAKGPIPCRLLQKLGPQLFCCTVASF